MRSLLEEISYADNLMCRLITGEVAFCRNHFGDSPRHRLVQSPNSFRLSTQCLLCFLSYIPQSISVQDWEVTGSETPFHYTPHILYRI